MAIVDISHHQPSSAINYNTFAKQLDFAIVRVQYGSLTEDREYKNHLRELQKRGVSCGVYAWIRGVSKADMRKEARDFYNRAKSFNPTFWFLDVEEKSMSDMRGGTSAFVDELRKHTNTKVGLYIAHHLYNPFNLNVKEADAVWIPRYPYKPQFPCDLHQFNEHGRLNGYNGDLDLNKIISNKSLSYFTGGKTGGKKKLNSVKKKKKSGGATYTVKSGDTLSGIAAKFNVTTKKLQNLNGIKNPNKISVGDKLKIKGKAKKGTASTKTYKIKSGDTLSGISSKFGTTTKKLQTLNGISNPNQISAGQTIKVTGKKGKKANSKKYHKVVSGDTVSQLAGKYGSTTAKIKKWNKLKNANAIQIGQRLRVK